MKKNVIKSKGRMFVETYEAEYIEQEDLLTEFDDKITGNRKAARMG